METFLEHIFGGAISLERRLAIFITPSVRTRFFADVAKAAGYARPRTGDQNVYFGLGLIKGSSGGRGKAEDVAAIGTLWADIDVARGPHEGKQLPTSTEDARHILERIDLAPSMLVDSGHGLHAYWLVKEPWVFDGEEDRQKAASLAKRWHGLVCAAAAELGWVLENLGDLARVLRLPGTLNHNGDEPVEVKLITCDPSVRYDIKRLEELLPDEEPKEHMPVQEPTESLDLSDGELLQQMFAASNGSDVKRLWEGDIDGYPSHSEADCALCAHLAFWTSGDAERIDALFRHSSLCREKWLIRPDYRERTISKALEGLSDTYRWGESNPADDVDLLRIAEQAKAKLPTTARTSKRMWAGCWRKSPVALRTGTTTSSRPWNLCSRALLSWPN